ncbi:MAG: tetratricopeptide repeat protein [Spirochaetales bacterium]|nr:tetratricopeptide repeat protein [Spirochaetales bacterium]
MMEILPIVIPAGVIILGAVAVFLIVTRKDKRKKSKKPKKIRDRNTILKEANKKLAQNPKDAEALLSLGNLYYSEEAWEKAMRTFEVLVDMCATNSSLDEFEVTTKYGLSAMRVNNHDEAYKSLLIARTMNAEIFEVNYNLGYLEYIRKNYEKSAGLLSVAVKDKPEHVPSLKYFGLSLFKLKRYQEAISILRKTLDLEPDDKESLFIMAQCYFNLGQSEKAIKIFSHLRPDPKMGPSAALFAGTINLNSRQYDKAVMDFEIGLRHKDIKRETAMELRYRLAAAYIKQQELSQALMILKEIQSYNPGYKDVLNLISQYSELNANQNLQTFLIAGTSEFVTLCRRLAISFFPSAKVKIVDISVQKTEFADIIAEVNAKKWEDVVVFRFVRTTGTVGELMLRDLYTRIKEVKAGRGFCVTAGNFTEGAVQFVEARLIDLIEKDALLSKLNTLDAKTVNLVD